MERKYEIWQMRTDENPDLLFRSWGEFLKKGVTPSPLTHEKIYEGSLPEIVSDEEELLEEIYTKFNTDNLADFKGHSLSMSDVIVLDRDGHRQGYFVDTFGFTPFKWSDDNHGNDECIAIPDQIANEYIGDYLSDLTGFCHKGFVIKEVK